MREARLKIDILSSCKSSPSSCSGWMTVFKHLSPQLYSKSLDCCCQGDFYLLVKFTGHVTDSTRALHSGQSICTLYTWILACLVSLNI